MRTETCFFKPDRARLVLNQVTSFFFKNQTETNRNKKSVLHIRSRKLLDKRWNEDTYCSSLVSSDGVQRSSCRPPWVSATEYICRVAVLNVCIKVRSSRWPEKGWSLLLWFHDQIRFQCQPSASSNTSTLLVLTAFLKVLTLLPLHFSFAPFWSWRSTESCEIHPEIT